MTLETMLRQVLAEYRVHVRKWRRCYRRAFPQLPADFDIEDVGDAEIELMLPSTDSAKGPNHNE